VSKGLPGSVAWQMAQKILCKWLLYDEEETQKSWKPMLNTIFALRGSSECSVQPNAHKFFVPSAKRHCRADLLTPQSYKLKKDGLNDHLFKANLFPQIQNRFHAILQIIIG